MKSRGLLLFVVLVAGLSSFSLKTLAGTGKIRFGAYTPGQGCSGTGICQSGATGAIVTFNYTQTLDSAGGTFTKLVMIANYEQAIANGFQGGPEGGRYIFEAAYTFNHPGDAGMGVPSTYTIPEGYEAIYGPKDQNGRISLVITQFKLNK